MEESDHYKHFYDDPYGDKCSGNADKPKKVVTVRKTINDFECPGCHSKSADDVEVLDNFGPKII